MPILELEKPEAKYRNNMAGNCHFSISCVCGGKDGKYSGYHFKNADEIFEEESRRYIPLRENKFEYTFYISEQLFLSTLMKGHDGKNKESPLVVICNDCEREFPFTHESYLDLRDEMMGEYNRRLSVKQDKTNSD